MHPIPSHALLTDDDASLLPLHPKEAALLRHLRALGFGTVHRLLVQDGLPVMAEEVTQQVKF